MGMYAENARMIHDVLQAVAPDFKLGIIAIGRPGSTLAMREWLDRGGLVGLLGDRYLVNEATRLAGSLEVPFLGQPVRFTDGPLRLAMLLRRRVIFMVGLYHGGKRYEVRFEPLADFTQPVADAAERERVLHAALRDYVARLEALVRESPFNWFNFYDYWGEDEAR
jgi:predicted LPLAT superfamily acyltransferase